MEISSKSETLCGATVDRTSGGGGGGQTVSTPLMARVGVYSAVS